MDTSGAQSRSVAVRSAYISMPATTKPRERSKWKVRLAIFLLLIVPLYLVPSIARMFLLGHFTWVLGILISDSVGCLAVGFLTNNYRFAALVYVATTTLELLLVYIGHERALALWIGDLVPALIAIYFAQRLFINMGD